MIKRGDNDSDLVEMELLFKQNNGKQHESYNDNDHYEPALMNEE